MSLASSLHELTTLVRSYHSLIVIETAEEDRARRIVEARHAIFAIHLSLRKQDPAAFGLDDLVFASEGMSGAEIEAAVVAALYRALHEKRPLGNGHLIRELDATVPLSVSRREDIDRLRAHAAGRFTPVGRISEARAALVR